MRLRILSLLALSILALSAINVDSVEAQGCLATYDLTVSQGDWSLRYVDATRWVAGSGFEQNGANILFVQYVFGENRYISKISWFASGAGSVIYNQPTGWAGSGNAIGITTNKPFGQLHTVNVNQTLPGFLFFLESSGDNTVLSYVQIDYCDSTPTPSLTPTQAATATPNLPTNTPYIEPSPIPPYFATATATRTPFGIPTPTLLPLATADGGNFTAFVTQQWRPEMRSYGWDVPALGVLVPVTQAPAPTVDPTRGAIVTNMQGMNSTLEAQISMLNATPTAWLLPDGTTFSVAAQDEEFENLLLLLFAYIKGLDAEDWGQLAPLITLTVGILIYMVLIQAFNIVWRILTTIFSIIFSLFKSVIGFVRG